MSAKTKQAAASTRVMYVGPTIVGVADHNVTYSAIPDTLTEAAKDCPILLSLCVPVSNLPTALRQIQEQSGRFYTFYQQAVAYNAALRKKGA